MTMNGVFARFEEKTRVFRNQLATEMRTGQHGIREFCPMDGEMIHYLERWIDDTREHRQIGHTDEKYIDEEVDGGDDIRATETEMLRKMMKFIITEKDPMVEMFGQIHTHRHPTIIEDEDYGRLLDFPYQNSVAIYQKEMLDMITESGDYALHSPCRAFAVRVLNDEVEGWMKKFAVEYIRRKIEDATATV